MELMAWQNKLIALWVFSVLNLIAIGISPEFAGLVLAQLAASSETGEATLGGPITGYFFLTCLMIWLTLVLKPDLSRWPIMLVGAFFTFVKVSWIVTLLTGDLVLSLLFNEIWGLVVALMIIWYGWKIPATTAQ
jgi:hypothetical protein